MEHPSAGKAWEFADEVPQLPCGDSKNVLDTLSESPVSFGSRHSQ